jgi:rfaE bifunctional protein kinase chain/domain
VKGREYEHNQDPRFLAERDCVMRFGGRVVFSSGDIVYSSTSLIGTLQQPEVFQDEKVKRFRQQYNLTDFHLANLIDSFRGRRIVVVGDYILDRYHFCDATNIASEGPMMSLRHLRHEDYDGGAAIIALHLAGLGAQATLVTSLAHDDQSLEIEARLMARGMETQCLHHRRQVVTKHRYLVDQSKLFKIDQGGTAPLDSAQEQILMEHIFAAAEGADGIIFADFGYGVLTAPLLDRILPELRPRVAVITADISGMQSNLLRFRDVDLLCPTERELREEMHDFSSGLNAVVCGLFEATAARHAFITMGKQGLIVFDQYRKPDGQEAWERRLRSEYLPAMTSVATDPLGCGDALLATASLALAAGGTAHAAAFLGSLAAAIEVQHVGNHPITTEQLLGRLTNQQPSRVEPARLAS